MPQPAHWSLSAGLLEGSQCAHMDNPLITAPFILLFSLHFPQFLTWASWDLSNELLPHNYLYQGLFGGELKQKSYHLVIYP